MFCNSKTTNNSFRLNGKGLFEHAETNVFLTFPVECLKLVSQINLPRKPLRGGSIINLESYHITY